MAIKLNPDGTITAPVAGTEYKLRAPFLDELFELWAAIDEISRQEQADQSTLNAAVRTQVVASADAMVAEPGEEATVEAPSTTELQLRLLRVNAAWMERAFRMLATPSLPDDFRSPSWFASSSVARDFLLHWQTVPLDPGTSA